MNREHFSIEYVQSISNTLKMNKIKCYEIFLNEVKKLIINKAKQGDNSLLYQIPPFKLGVPPYNRQDCAIFLHDKLKDMRFEVEIIKKIDNFILNITWGHYIQQNNITNNKSKTAVNQVDNKYTFIHSNGIIDEIPINNQIKTNSRNNTIHI